MERRLASIPERGSRVLPAAALSIDTSRWDYEIPSSNSSKPQRSGRGIRRPQYRVQRSPRDERLRYRTEKVEIGLASLRDGRSRGSARRVRQAAIRGVRMLECRRCQSGWNYRRQSGLRCSRNVASTSVASAPIPTQRPMTTYIAYNETDPSVNSERDNHADWRCLSYITLAYVLLL